MAPPPTLATLSLPRRAPSNYEVSLARYYADDFTPRLPPYTCPDVHVLFTKDVPVRRGGTGVGIRRRECAPSVSHPRGLRLLNPGSSSVTVAFELAGDKPRSADDILPRVLVGVWQSPGSEAKKASIDVMLNGVHFVAMRKDLDGPGALTVVDAVLPAYALYKLGGTNTISVSLCHGVAPWSAIVEYVRVERPGQYERRLVLEERKRPPKHAAAVKQYCGSMQRDLRFAVDRRSRFPGLAG